MSLSILLLFLHYFLFFLFGSSDDCSCPVETGTWYNSVSLYRPTLACSCRSEGGCFGRHNNSSVVGSDQSHGCTIASLHTVCATHQWLAWWHYLINQSITLFADMCSPCRGHIFNFSGIIIDFADSDSPHKILTIVCIVAKQCRGATSQKTQLPKTSHNASLSHFFQLKISNFNQMLVYHDCCCYTVKPKFSDF